MFYTYKNCKIEIDGQLLLARNMSFSVNASTSPIYDTNNKFSYQYAATDPVNGTIDLEYYLTGNDPVKTKLYEEKTGSISGNLGGLVFNSGYITKYQLDAAPDEAAIVRVGLSFFDQVTGDFSPIAGSPPKDEEILNCSNITLNGTGLGEYADITNVTFSYSNDVKRQYGIETGLGVTNIKPDRIVFGSKTATTSVRYSNLSGEMSFYGEKGLLVAYFTQEGGSSIVEEFGARGIIVNKKVGGTSTSNPQGVLSITQDKPSEISQITGISKLSGYVGDTVCLSGYNFNSFPTIKIGGIEVRGVDYKSDTELCFKLPNVAITGGFVTTTDGDGEDESSSTTNSFIIAQEEVGIYNIIPTTGLIGDRIIINGRNIDVVDRIYFTSGSWVDAASFNILTSGLMEAEVPRLAQHGPINIHSTWKESSGISSENFTPNPEIEDLSDAFPYPYATINISGLALSGVTGIFFGDNRLSGTVNSGEVTRTDILPVVVPSGNLGTYFEIVGISGLSTVYSGIGTSARLTGIQPLSGQEGDLITISGQNLVTGVLERNNHNASLESFNHWNVNFGGVTTGFGLVTASGAITGHVPAGVTAGLTYIQLRNNLSSVHRSGIYFDILDRPPTINEVYSS